MNRDAIRVSNKMIIIGFARVKRGGILTTEGAAPSGQTGAQIEYGNQPNNCRYNCIYGTTKCIKITPTCIVHVLKSSTTERDFSPA